MDNPSLNDAEVEVLAFVDALYALPTIHYAANHSQMEAWVALEALAFFMKREWVAWESVGFKHGSGELKFPDLVCVKGDLSLWWEFKAIYRRILHPKKNAGGTLVADVRAFTRYHKEDTQAYLRTGLRRVGGNNDERTLKASGLREMSLGAKQNVGVALLFSPNEDLCAVPGHGDSWCPAATVEEISTNVAGLSDSIRGISPKIAERIAKVTPGTACDGWLVPMGT